MAAWMGFLPSSAFRSFPALWIVRSDASPRLSWPFIHCLMRPVDLGQAPADTYIRGIDVVA